MPPKRVRPRNERVAALIQRALEDADMTAQDLGRVTGWKRNADAFARGEVQRPAPDQLAELARHLPITVEQLLTAYGYALTPRPSRDLPPDLTEVWWKLPPQTRKGMLALMQAAAKLAQGEVGDTSP